MIRSKLICVLIFFSAIHSFAAEVQVPDLETRIKNSGNVIPENALPVLSSPGPSVLPQNSEIPVQRVVSDEVISDSEDSTQAESIEMDPFIPLDSFPSISGTALLGAGSPGTIRGELSLVRSAHYSNDHSVPSLALNFHYDSADGFGLKKTGTGFFDRSVQLAGTVASGDMANTEKASWYAGVDLRERTDGFQGLNSFYYSLNTRSVSWDSGISNTFSGSDLLTWGLTFAGSSLSAFADSPGGNSVPASPADATFIPQANRYTIFPSIHLNFSKELSGKTIPGFIAASLTGSYSFTGMADTGEFHRGGGDLSFAYRYKRIETALFTDIHYDSASGVLFPFSARFLYENIGSFLSRLSIEGGLSASVSDPSDIRLLEPFAHTNLLPIIASDWFGTLSVHISPVQMLSLGTAFSYKTTAFSRGGWNLTSNVQENGLLNIEEMSRDSFHVSSEAVWKPSFFTFSLGYSGEFLDSLYLTSLHSVSLNAEVFDTGEFSKWKAGLNSLISLDAPELPFVDLYGSFKPAKNISILCTVKDAIPPLVGKNRDRWGGYIARSGELLLSARLDF